MLFRFLSGEGASARNHYRVLLEIQSQGHEDFEKELEEAFNRGTYETDKKPILRKVDSKRIVEAVTDILKTDNIALAKVKYVRKYRKFRCLAIASLRIFGDLSMKEISGIFMGYTSSAISKLFRDGFRMLEDDEELYMEIEAAIM